MAKRILLLIPIFLLLIQSQIEANYDQEERRGEEHHEKEGSDAGTQAAVGLFTAVLQKAAQQQEAKKKEPEPPPVVTVAEVPVPEEVHGECEAEVEVKREKDSTPFVFNIPIYIPLSAPDKFSCCEVRSLEFKNIWQHPLELRVEKAKGKAINPGETVKLSGDWGECVRVTALSHGQQEKTDEHLVIEDLHFCCDELRSKGPRRPLAMQLVDFSFEEKDPPCGEKPKEFEFICCESCPGHLGDRYYSPLLPDTECQPGDILHKEWVFGEKPCANPLLENHPGPLVQNPECPPREEGTCPAEYKPCSSQPVECSDGFIEQCIQAETCKYQCCRCTPKKLITTTKEQCPAGYNACGAPAECPKGEKAECIQTETCEKSCCRCVKEETTQTKDKCPPEYNVCGTPVECPKDSKKECVQSESCKEPCCRCTPETIVTKKEECPSGYSPCGTPVECPKDSEKECVQSDLCDQPCCRCTPETIVTKKEECPSGYSPCGTPVECPKDSTRQCIQVETCPEQCCKCEPKIIEENHCPPDYPPCGQAPPVCSDGFVRDCVHVPTCPEDCCKCVPKTDDKNYCPPQYPPCGQAPEACPDGFIRNCVKVPTCPNECCKCEPQDQRSCPPGFGPCSPNPIQCLPGQQKECVQSPDCPYDCCRCVQPPPPPPPPPCQCSCTLTQKWDAGSAIQSQLISPLPDPDVVQVPVGHRVPLVAESMDRDQHEISCHREETGGDQCAPSCDSKLTHYVPVTVKYHWEILSGVGKLIPTTDGPAVLYEAPAFIPANTLVHVRLTVDEDPAHHENANDEGNQQDFTLKIVEQEEPLKFKVGAGLQSAAPEEKREGDCLCKPEKKWEKNGPIQATADEQTIFACPNDYEVLSAEGSDSDILKMKCGDDKCSSPEESLNQSDFVYYSWVTTAGRIIGGKTKQVVLETPKEPREITITRSVTDSGEQASDEPVNLPPLRVQLLNVKLKEILGLRKNAPGDFNQEADPHANGRIFIDTQDNGEILAAPDVQRVKLTAEIEPPEADPSKLKIRWELYDPDDPADHRDVDASPRGGDNTGKAHEGAPHWFMPADHAISNQIDRNPPGDEKTIFGEAKTEVTRVGGRLVSTVYFYYGDDGGDNYQIRAVLEKESNPQCSEDQSGTLTAWRKRFVKVYAMTKDNDDVAVHPQGSRPGRFVVCINPGPNGVLDTLQISSHDNLIRNQIRSGFDGVCDTTPNSGGNSFDPVATQNLFRRYYAQADANHLPYLDIVVTQEQFDRPFVPVLLVRDIPDYMHRQTNFTTHDSYVFSLLGVNDLMDGFIPDVVGYGGYPPHAAASAGALKRQVPRQLPKTDIHELGHMLMNPVHGVHDMHANHSVGFVDCGYQQGNHPPRLCPLHASIIRDKVRRTFTPNHQGGMENNDSEVSRNWNPNP